MTQIPELPGKLPGQNHPGLNLVADAVREIIRAVNGMGGAATEPPELSEITQRLSATEQATTDLTGRVTDAESALTSLESSVSTLTGRVTALESPPTTPPPPPDVAFVRVELTDPTLEIGEQTEARGVAMDANSVAIPGVPITFQSGNLAVARVTADGVVTAIGNGLTRVNALVNGEVKGYAELDVSPLPTEEPPPTEDPEQPAPTPTLFDALLGPLPKSADSIRALGDAFRRYVDDRLLPQAERHWTLDGVGWEKANYYDRAHLFYYLYKLTGDPKWRDRAAQLAVNYRDTFLRPDKTDGFAFNSSTFWHQPVGLALHYLDTGDEASRKAVGYSAEWLTTQTYLKWISDRQSNGWGVAENRIRSRCLQAAILAHLIAAPQGGPGSKQVAQIPGTWKERAKILLDACLAAQSPDGAYRDLENCGFSKPFMDGLLNEALTLYHRHIDADARIVGAIKRNLDYNVAKVYDTATASFYYYEGACSTNGGGNRTPSPDLNGIIVPAFGWVAKQTGDGSYLTKGDPVFAAMVDTGWWDGSKQFNELAATSYRYLAYRGA